MRGRSRRIASPSELSLNFFQLIRATHFGGDVGSHSQTTRAVMAAPAVPIAEIASQVKATVAEVPSGEKKRYCILSFPILPSFRLLALGG